MSDRTALTITALVSVAVALGLTRLVLALLERVTS